MGITIMQDHRGSTEALSLGEILSRMAGNKKDGREGGGVFRIFVSLPITYFYNFIPDWVNPWHL